MKILAHRPTRVSAVATYSTTNNQDSHSEIWWENRDGEEGDYYTYRYIVTTRMTCIKMGSDESHFNASLTVRDTDTRLSTDHNLFEEKGEPKRNRAEALLFTSLMPYRWAKPAHKDK